MLKCMPQANITANSTQGMSVPTLFGQEDSRTSNKGKNLARAGRRAFSDGTRRQRAQKEITRLQRLHADHVEVKRKAGTQNDPKRKREENWLEDEEALQAKRMREDVALSAPLSTTSALALLPQFVPFLQVPPKPEANSHRAPQSISHKRSHEDNSTNNEPGLEGPSKRPKAQHMALDQLMTRSTSRPKAPPRPCNRRAGRNVGSVASGNGFSTIPSAIARPPLTSHATQAEPQQIR